jgi:hypothetical protein
MMSLILTKVYSIQHYVMKFVSDLRYVMKFVSDLRQVGGFLQVLYTRLCANNINNNSTFMLSLMAVVNVKLDTSNISNNSLVCEKLSWSSLGYRGLTEECTMLVL